MELHAHDAIVIESMLTDVARCLTRVPLTEGVRDLHLRALAYKRLLRDWAHLPPPEANRTALLECVRALHEEAVAKTGGPARERMHVVRTARRG